MFLSLYSGIDLCEFRENMSIIYTIKYLIMNQYGLHGIWWMLGMVLFTGPYPSPRLY
jgi:hypothetical protein